MLVCFMLQTQYYFLHLTCSASEFQEESSLSTKQKAKWKIIVTMMLAYTGHKFCYTIWNSKLRCLQPNKILLILAGVQ